MLKHRILICGGREYDDAAKFKTVMESIRSFLADDFCIIHGGARGADSFAQAYAMTEGIPCILMSASWNKYHKAAGSIRNRWMIKYAMPDLCIAFPGGKGTADMVVLARKAGIDVYEVI